MYVAKFDEIVRNEMQYLCITGGDGTCSDLGYRSR